MDRGSYRRALWAAQLDGQITPKTYLVGRALLCRADRRGRRWPSLDTLAADVGCCARTAGSAVALLRLLGLLNWVECRASRFTIRNRGITPGGHGFSQAGRGIG